MKKIHLTILSALFALVLVVTSSLMVKNAQAATGLIYLTPASQSILNGSTFTLNLRVNPGTAIDTVSANVSYDSSKLSLQNVSCTGSPLTPVVCSSGNPAQFASAIL